MKHVGMYLVMLLVGHPLGPRLWRSPRPDESLGTSSRLVRFARAFSRSPHSMLVSPFGTGALISPGGDRTWRTSK